MGTKSTWFPGHDGRATGWATRVEKGMPLEAVPANERAGAEFMLRRRGSWLEAVMTPEIAERIAEQADTDARRAAGEEIE